MRILSVGNFGHGWDGSICDEEHIAGALEELGHQVTRLQREETVPDYAKFPEVEVDFILLAQWDGYTADLVGTLLRHYYKDSPIIYWAFDYQAEGQEWHERLVEQSDIYLSKRLADSKYPNWQWLSQDFAPDFLFEVPGKVEQDIDILFTGSYLDWATERNETIQAVGEKYNLLIHSVNPWPQGNEGPVMDEALPELYYRSKIVLSIDHTLESGYWSDRNAQIMCCGAFALFRYIPLSEARFGSGIAYFYSIEDCLRKIEYYLNNEYERRVIAGNGYHYAQRYLKVKSRVRDLLTIVEARL